MLEQPAAAAAWEMQVMMQGEMPAVEVGVALVAVSLCAWTEAAAAAAATARAAVESFMAGESQ